MQQVRNDPLCKRIFRIVAAWEGVPQDTQEFTQGNSPAIRLTPTCGPDMWASNDAVTGWLYIDVDIQVPGRDVGDMFDAWWAIMRALYPPDSDARNAFQRDLQHAWKDPDGCIMGALTGLVEFSQPPADDAPKDQYQAAVGQLRVQMRHTLNV